MQVVEFDLSEIDKVVEKFHSLAIGNDKKISYEPSWRWVFISVANKAFKISYLRNGLFEISVVAG